MGCGPHCPVGQSQRVLVLALVDTQPRPPGTVL